MKRFVFFLAALLLLLPAASCKKFREYRRAKGAVTIAQLERREPNDLVAHYTMKRQDNRLIDDEGNHDGAIVGGKVVSIGTGPAFSLNGRTDAVFLGSWFRHQTFSLSFWVRTGASQVEYACILDNNHTDKHSFNVQQKPGVVNRFGFGVHTLDKGAVNIEFDLKPGIWTHLVLRKEGGAISAFQDGKPLGTRVVPGDGDIYYDGTERLFIGQYGGGGRNWQGEIRDLRIYRISIPEELILQLARASGR